VLLIGDVHGKLKQYSDLVKNHEESIVLGDFGFKHEYDNKPTDNNHKILFGNHDYYPYINKDYSLGDYGVYNDMFYIRGAFSIDWMYRVYGRDLFENEELSYEQFNNVINYYSKVKPEIVISHEAPNSIVRDWFGYKDRNITKQGLQAILEIHKPKLWVFGHHHKSIKRMVGSTEFICLNELETLLIK
jgi:predicted phosphodiesterase